LLLLGGAVSILVIRELESDPSGRGIQAPWDFGESGRGRVIGARRPRRGSDLGGEVITGVRVFAQVVALIRYCARSVDPKGRNHVGGEETHTRLTAWVRGRVQGVGFRWWTRSRALELGLVGSASNLADGRVEVIAEGSRDHCQRLLTALRSGESPGSVETVVERWSEPKGGLTGFVER
jgi:acylphosphatase